MVAETFSPAGAGPVRSLNTPTIPGRRLGSLKPLRRSEYPVWAESSCCPAACSVGVVGARPTKVANVPASEEVISRRWHAAVANWVRGTLAITTLRSVTSTRCEFNVTKREFREASRPFCGASPSTIPPCGGIPRSTSHGTVAVTDTGVSEINGAVTLFSCPFCGQFSVAVVCTTGSSGVSTARTNPTRPAMVATHRVTVTSECESGARVASVCVVMGAPSSREGPDRSATTPAVDPLRPFVDVRVRGLRGRHNPDVALDGAPVAVPVITQIGRHRRGGQQRLDE